jgi:hypothetical protein
MDTPCLLPAHDALIVEGIVTTQNSDGSPHIAPMGPKADRGLTRLLLRPFRTSQTYRNLKQHGAGVFHVTDDVELIARAAVGKLTDPPPTVPATNNRGWILSDACRWFAFRVTDLDDSVERTTISCVVVAQGVLRDFLGFNRAKHAIVEAAILATRIGILPAEQIRQEIAQLATPVEKTAGEQERRAFAFLKEYIDQHLTPGT